MMIILLILITLSLDSVWILLGENCCWSLLGLKGLNKGKMTLVQGKADMHQLKCNWFCFALPCTLSSKFDLL